MHEFLEFILQNSITMLWLVPCLQIINRIMLKHCGEKYRYYMYLLPIMLLLLPIRCEVVVHMRFMRGESQMPLQPEQVALNSDAAGGWGIRIWMSGFFLLLVFSMIRHIRFGKMISRWQRDFKCRETVERFEILKKEYGISRQIQFKLCPCIHTPMTVRFFRPMILLPAETYSEEELDAIILHELTHIKRMDVCYKILVILFLAVYWFHPFAYWIAVEMNNFCETSCDEVVLKGAEKGQRSRYAQMLLRMACSNYPGTETVLGMKFLSAGISLKRRVWSARHGVKKQRYGIVMVMLAGFIICVGLTVQVECKEAAGEAVPYELSSTTQEQKEIEYTEDEIQKDVVETADIDTGKRVEAQTADGETELVLACLGNGNTVTEIYDVSALQNMYFETKGYAFALSDSSEQE